MDAAPMTASPIAVEVVTGVCGTFIAPTGDLITEQIKTYGAHARNELALLRSLVRPGDCIVDLGAHIGTFTIPLAVAAGPTGALLAIDGNPLAHALLTANVQINGLGHRITTRHALLGRVGEFSDGLTNAPGNTGSARFARSSAGMLAFVSARAILAQEGFSTPDIIKIDVEGMEGILVEDLEPVFTAARPICYFEVSTALRSSGTTAEALGMRFLRLGYRLFRNEGPRNSSTDQFRLVELPALADERTLFDCLAIPRDHERIRDLDCVSTTASTV
jgi:FkbM family methyltransferase